MTEKERKFPVNESTALLIDDNTEFIWEMGLEDITSTHSEDGDTYTVRYPFVVAVSIGDKQLLATKVTIPMIVPGPLMRMGAIGWVKHYTMNAINKAQDAIVSEAHVKGLKSSPFDIKHPDVTGISRFINHAYTKITGVDNTSGLGD